MNNEAQKLPVKRFGEKFSLRLAEITSIEPSQQFVDFMRRLEKEHTVEKLIADRLLLSAGILAAGITTPRWEAETIADIEAARNRFKFALNHSQTPDIIKRLSDEQLAAAERLAVAGIMGIVEYQPNQFHWILHPTPPANSGHFSIELGNELQRHHYDAMLLGVEKTWWDARRLNAPLIHSNQSDSSTAAHTSPPTETAADS